ncbi:uncharacterized protein LAESUDRAFT_751634 [Laetiporus sulphureus 93-53]|uniref:Fungal-type protein kinase domain-containing protein n=1 Tax=Laetiporus sulphureus 93-53 TaxID=1314785 RepID=A0A165CST3_9APHY|nr:uncharacterized protein LAESUDRAFT_751634 [Laetiporus sulphureus 93-53]KZT03374.1 hypothetical protein LAESUDRAFT_751634 [Laetiporus sulphureus 93-53]
MPCDEFLENVCHGYCKLSFDGMPSPVDAFKDVPQQAEKQLQIYDPFISAVNGGNGQPRCPGIKFTHAPSRAEEQGVGWLQPDVMGFSDDMKISEKSKSTASVEHMGYAEIFVEVKRSPDNDIFMDPPENVKHDEHLFILNPSSLSSKEELKIATEALGQNVAYAAEILARQHRRFLISMSMSGSRMRFLLWDRSGVLVTESFDLHEHPEILCKFLWWFSHSSYNARGYDLTVRMSVNEKEEKMFKDAMTKHVKEQLLLCTSKEDAMRLGRNEMQVAQYMARIEDDKKCLMEALRDHYQPGSVIAADVFHEAQDDEGKVKTQVERVLVSCPVTSPKSVASRGTRGYWTMFADGSVGFLKDTWRHAGEGFEQEGKTIWYLNEHNVQNVPNVVCHGDVKERRKDDKKPQTTVVHRYNNADWVCRGTAHRNDEDEIVDNNARRRKIKVRGRIHYRLVLDIAGYKLQYFSDSHELLHGTRDVLTAMIDAYSADKIHRGQSTTNIILYRRPGEERRIGYLIDWKFGCDVSHPPGDRLWRINGTWQFMSANVLDGDDTYRHVVEDDMEALLYIVLDCAARWSEQDEGINWLRTSFWFLGENVTMDGVSMGGSGKLMNKLNRKYTKDLKFTCQPLQDWLNAALDLNNPVGPAELGSYPPQWTLERLAKLWDDALAKPFDNMPDRIEHEIPGVEAQTQYRVSNVSVDSCVIKDQEDPRSREQGVATPVANGGKQREGEPDSGRGEERNRQGSASVDQPEASGSAAQDTMDFDAEKDTTNAVREKSDLRKRRASSLVDNERTKKTRNISPRVKASTSEKLSRTHQQSSEVGPSGQMLPPQLQASGSGMQVGPTEDVPLRRSSRSRRPPQRLTTVNVPALAARRISSKRLFNKQ